MTGEVQSGRVGHEQYKMVDCSNEKKKSIIPSLPEEIIFSILVWLPADVLYNSVRYVCRKWNDIIRDPLFITEQLIHSPDGLLIRRNQPSQTAHFVEVGKMNATVRVVSFPFPNMVWATCDGLVLCTNTSFCLHVVNPLTKQTVTVPPPSCDPSCFYFSLACSPLMREHKVVFAYMCPGGKFFEIMIVTVGKDSAWRLISSEKLSDPCRRLLFQPLISTGGFLCWACCSHTCIVALDVESETFCVFPSPTVQSSNDNVFYVRWVRSLSCIVRLSPGTLFDVWVLPDPMSGEWRKLYKIDFAVQKYRSSGMFNGFFSRRTKVAHFRPTAWVNNGEVVVFFAKSRPGPFIAHNVKTRETFVFGSHEMFPLVLRGYSYSLVSPKPT